jgi:hypothetical protein
MGQAQLFTDVSVVLHGEVGARLPAAQWSLRDFGEISDRYRDMKDRFAVQLRASATFAAGLGD